jgi:RNA polymerase sigma factor (sigma-70 family)
MLKFLSPYNNEETLAKACREANPKAQRFLYEKYSRKMLGVCVRYVGDDFEAEDVMIEGFVKVFEKIDQYKSEGSFEGWIRRIMVNESLMHLRSKRREGFAISYEDVLYEPEPQEMISDLDTEGLFKAVESLPTGYKTVFNLYAIEGYSHAEIATTLGISEGTSKSQLSRARDMLQKMVSSQNTPPRRTLTV